MSPSDTVPSELRILTTKGTDCHTCSWGETAVTVWGGPFQQAAAKLRTIPGKTIPIRMEMRISWIHVFIRIPPGKWYHRLALYCVKSPQR